MATLPRHQVRADPLLQHENAEADVEGSQGGAGLPRRGGARLLRRRRRGRGGLGELRAARAGPGAEPHVRAAPGARSREEEAQACGGGGRRPSSSSAGRGGAGREQQQGNGGRRVRAVPHAGDDVPRQPGVPQLQVPAPTQPRRAAAAGGA